VAQFFIKYLVRLHGVLGKILLDRDAKCTSKFWKELFTSLEMEFFFNTTYHLQTDGNKETISMILEDILRMYVIHQQRRWEEYLSLVEFAYNNGYQKSLRMSLFEAL